MKDLSPKLQGLLPAEIELQIPVGTVQIGERIGGVAMYSSVFKRGYGETTFGVDDNGLWLGKAEFSGAPFRVSRGDVRIIINDNTNDRILIGKDEGGF